MALETGWFALFRIDCSEVRDAVFHRWLDFKDAVPPSNCRNRFNAIRSLDKPAGDVSSGDHLCLDYASLLHQSSACDQRNHSHYS